MNRPILVVGLPRSGTTLLHRFLADQPGMRPLRTWELFDVFRAPDAPVDPIRREAAASIRALLRVAPELETKHTFGIDEPEEEVTLFDASLWTVTFWRFAMVSQYQAWRRDADPRPGYRDWLDTLRLLQADAPSARLILKLPNHTGYVDIIRKLLPDAVLVQCHRDPAPVIASYASLTRSMHAMSTARTDRDELGRQSVRLWQHHVERNLAARAQEPALDILDVRFTDLMSDLGARMERVLDHAGLPVPSDLDAQVRQHQARKGAKHVYSLADYGLDEPQVREAFSAYIARFLD